MKHWEKIGRRPHHGIDVKLSALHSKNSCAIGEFYDLIPLIDWCAEVGFDTIQLLPLNDSGNDPSPYNCISTCALNPLYIHVDGLPQTRALKLEALRRLAASQKQDDHFLEFCAKNSWLLAYTQITHPTSPFLQYLCYKQLCEVKAYAAQKKIFLMGDIPSLISRESADVKENPNLFDLTLAAGAPPDEFNKDGQYWGLPLYNWDTQKEAHYAWWKRRLEYASNFYDIYRIDHLVGLFRIWGIPLGKPAKEGHFVPQDKSLWLPQGKERLQMLLDASPMLPIAEDLGTVPKFVHQVLLDMGICGMRVMRWAKEYPPLSLTTVSTHDTETLQQLIPTLTSAQRLEILRASHQTPSYFHINLLQEYLALFPELVSPNPADEQINIPGTVLSTNWTYRYRPSVEELTSHAGLKNAIQEILK